MLCGMPRMSQVLLRIILPFAIEMIKKYIKSSDTKLDDKILDVMNISARYVVDKDNEIFDDAIQVTVKSVVK